MLLIKRGVVQSDDKLIGRAIRQVFAFRKKFDSTLLKHIITTNLPENNERRTLLLEFLSMDEMVDVNSNNISKSDEQQIDKLVFPETEIFLQLLVTVYLIDKKQYKEVRFIKLDFNHFIGSFLFK